MILKNDSFFFWFNQANFSRKRGLNQTWYLFLRNFCEKKSLKNWFSGRLVNWYSKASLFLWSFKFFLGFKIWSNYLHSCFYCIFCYFEHHFIIKFFLLNFLFNFSINFFLVNLNASFKYNIPYIPCIWYSMNHHFSSFTVQSVWSTYVTYFDPFDAER